MSAVFRIFVVGRNNDLRVLNCNYLSALLLLKIASALNRNPALTNTPYNRSLTRLIHPATKGCEFQRLTPTSISKFLRNTSKARRKAETMLPKSSSNTFVTS